MQFPDSNHSILKVARWAAGAFTLSWLIACSNSPVDTKLNELRSAEALWARVGSQNYTVDQFRTCFCPPPQSAHIAVTNGQIVSGTEQHTAKPLTLAELKYFSTVPEIFAQIRTALVRYGAKVDVYYDPATGYPTRFFVDPDEQAADEEYGYNTFALVKLPN